MVGGISESAARLATILLLSQSTWQTLSPSNCIQSYGMTKKVGPMLGYICEFISEGTGTVTLSWAIAMYLIFFRASDDDDGPLRAIGLSLIATIYHNAKALMTDMPRTLDMPAAGQWISLASKLIVCVSILSDCNHSRALAKMFALFGVLSGMKLALAPQEAARDWGSHINVPAHPSAECLLRVLGQNVVGYAVFIGCIASEVTPTRSLGLSIVPSLLSNIHLSYFSSVYDRATVNKDAILAWMLVGAVLIVVLIGDI
jgi:hypothetical protein